MLLPSAAGQSDWCGRWCTSLSVLAFKRLKSVHSLKTLTYCHLFSTLEQEEKHTHLQISLLSPVPPFQAKPTAVFGNELVGSAGKGDGMVAHQ